MTLIDKHPLISKVTRVITFAYLGGQNSFVMMVGELLEGALEKRTGEIKWEIKWPFYLQNSWPEILLLWLFFCYVCRLKFRQIKC